MKTKINLEPKKMLNKAMDTTKNVAVKANDYALNTTETVVTESLEVAEQWQTVANKAIKDGFKLAAAQQDLVFEALNIAKGQFKLGKKRFTKLIA
ncbi:MAG: hypothetical protein ACSHXF_11575 [Aquaticitalea sp.]